MTKKIHEILKISLDSWDLKSNKEKIQKIFDSLTEREPFHYPLNYITNRISFLPRPDKSRFIVKEDFAHYFDDTEERELYKKNRILENELKLKGINLSFKLFLL